MRGWAFAGCERLIQNESRNISRLFVIPAKAVIQGSKAVAVALDPRFQGYGIHTTLRAQ